MPKRWERELGRLQNVDAPTARIRERAAEGPTSAGREPERSGRQRVVAGVVAFAVFAAAGVFAWQAFRPVGGEQLGPAPAVLQGVVVNFVATDQQNGARGTLTSGDQTSDGFIGSHCWTFPGGTGCADTVAPSFVPNAFVPVERGSTLTVTGDANPVTGEIDRDGPFPFDRVEDFGTITDPIVLDQPAGRYVLSFNAHFDQGDVPFYFPIEIVEVAPSLVMSVDSAPDAAHPPEATFRLGDVTSHVVAQGGSAWFGGADAIGYVVDAPIPVGTALTVESNANDVTATIGGCCPVDPVEPLTFAEDRTTTLPSDPGQYQLVVAATWPEGRAEYTVYLNLVDPAVAGVSVAVFNATSTPGFAAELQQQLEGLGFEAAQDPADWPVHPISSTTIYYRAGQDPAAKDAARYLAEGLLSGADVEVLTDAQAHGLVPDEAGIAVVIGTDYRPTGGDKPDMGATLSMDQRLGVYEAMIRRLADPHGSKPIYVSAELCSMLAGDRPCDRISSSEQQELITRLGDLGTITFTGRDGPALTGRFQEIVLGPIIEKPDGLRVEGGSVCGSLCGSGSMYIVVPTDTGYEITGTDDSYGSWVS